MFRVQCTAIIFPARRCVPWKNSSRRRRGGFGPPAPPLPPLIATESVVSSPRLVVRKYYSSEKKKSPAPSSEDSKLLRAFNRVDFQRRVAKLSAVSLIIFSSNRDLPNFISLYLFARNFLIDSKGKFNSVKEKKRKREKSKDRFGGKSEFFLRSLGKDNENISVNQERRAARRLVRAYEALATAAIIPTWKRSLLLFLFYSSTCSSSGYSWDLFSLPPLYYYFPPLSPQLSAPRGVNHP